MNSTTNKSAFDVLFSYLPNCVVGSFDPLAHKTLSDLRFITQHELDLYEEGEDNDIRDTVDLKNCRTFLRLADAAIRAENNRRAVR